MLRCDSCRVLITQTEADIADAVYHSEGTYCPSCAAAFAEGETDDPEAGEPN